MTLLWVGVGSVLALILGFALVLRAVARGLNTVRWMP